LVEDDDGTLSLGELFHRGKQFVAAFVREESLFN
jgi:hypothetical protein